LKTPTTTGKAAQVGANAAIVKTPTTIVASTDKSNAAARVSQGKKIVATASAAAKSVTVSVESPGPAGALVSKRPVGRPRHSASPKQTYGLKILYHNFQLGKFSKSCVLQSEKFLALLLTLKYA
jgi:hypothetical protein